MPNHLDRKIKEPRAKITGYSVGPIQERRTGSQGFSTIKGSLINIKMFHADRGNKFINALIDELHDNFQTSRSLSMKGCPYDNAVGESTFKMIKAKFVSCQNFDTLDQHHLVLAIMCAGSIASACTARWPTCHRWNLRKPKSFNTCPIRGGNPFCTTGVPLPQPKAFLQCTYENQLNQSSQIFDAFVLPRCYIYHLSYFVASHAMDTTCCLYSMINPI